MTFQRFFIFVAVVVFALAALLHLVDEAPDPKVAALLLYGGLAAFAAGHLS